MGYMFNKEEEQFLRDNFDGNSYAELTKLFNEKFGTNFTWDKDGYPKIERKCQRMGLRKYKDVGYSKEVDEFLLEYAPNNPLSWLCEQLKEQFGVIKSQDTLKAHCRETLGIKKKHGLVYEHTKDLQKKPIGTITAQGKAKKKFIKIADTGKGDEYDWKSYGRYLYEKEHGELPEGYQVIHIDGDSNNYDIGNLCAVTRYEHCILTTNKWHGKGEVTRTAIEYAKLRKALKDNGRTGNG